jgi:hypothetical protein
VTGLLTSPSLTMAHADPTPAPHPRQVVEELLRRKVDGIIGLVAAAGPVGQGQTSPRVAEAELFAKQVRQFLDAVDATGSGVSYSEAVVLPGDQTVVAHVRDYYATTAYWHTLAQGATGDVLVIDGGDVMRALST